MNRNDPYSETALQLHAVSYCYGQSRLIGVKTKERTTNNQNFCLQASSGALSCYQKTNQ